jgi:digeranylgeranylglycerophospholipid reductase
MMEHYDVIVVGAGPAGSTAARFAAESGASVLLLEKDREVGIPVRCAEGVGEKGLQLVVDIRPHWIAQKITGVILNSPKGLKVAVKSNDVGYVLNRKIFDYELAQMAAEAGCSVLTKAYVYDLCQENGRVSGVKVDHLGTLFSVNADIVIGADGIESRVGRWGGLNTTCAMHDMETCAQVTATNIELEDDFCHFYFGQDVAPSGYMWIFPKGGGVANVGLGISGDCSKKKSAMEYLQQNLSKYFPKAAILTTVLGGVICAPTLDEIVADGLMLVGDAAHQTVPVSGGGIVTGMIAGKIAGKVAGAAVKERNITRKRLSEYAKSWDKTEGRKNRIHYKLKNYIYKMTDRDLDDTARLLLELPMEKRTLVNIFKTALMKHPSLIVDILKVFA